MTLVAGRTVLLLVLIGAFCTGCGGAVAVSSGSGEVSSARRLSSGLPPLPSADIAGRLVTEQVLADLAKGRCPAQAPSRKVGMYLGSSLPAIQAVTMIVCRYRGGNDPSPSSLRGSATITNPATVESWRRRFNALPLVDPRKYFCPNDDESALLVGFLRNDPEGVVVHVSLRGCQFVTIGTVTRGTNGSFRNDLLRLVP